MKECPKCNKKHDKPGKYCSRSCANSRVFSDETRQLKSKRNKDFNRNQDTEFYRSRTIKAKEKIKSNEERKISGSFESLSDALKRKAILKEQSEKCDVCRIAMLWNGEPLNFQLDHINGDRTNNTRENLRMICPNCHSQTETFGARNGGKITNEQIRQALLEGLNNHKVCKKLGINPSKRSYERINKLRP